MKAVVTLSIVLLAACPLQKSVSYSGPGGGSQTAGSSGSSTTTKAEDPNAERERMAQYHAEQGQKGLDDGALLRHELEALRGLTVADAKAKAKAFGHTGEVRVRESPDFVKGCDPGIVCDATGEFGATSGMGDDDTLMLWTNKSLAISGPPE